MISRGELKKGIVIELEGGLYNVLDYQHIKMGRGSAQVRLKLRDLRARHTIERTFQAGERFRRARLDTRSMQYLYHEGDLHYFMDLESFEQIPLASDLLGEALNYLKEGLALEVLFHEDEPIGVELPLTVDLEVRETAPAFKGDTAQGGTKPATLETGLAVQVPFFVSGGDVVRIDTRSGTYLERVT